MGSFAQQIKEEALKLGFFTCGIAKAEPVEESTADRLKEWLSQGGAADMAYMNKHIDLRLDPTLLFPDVKSIVSVALSYAPARYMNKDEFHLAAYAYGRDYHDIVKEKLRLLAQNILQTMSDRQPNPTWRAFCDSAPILERYWAEKAGLGWTGRNHQLIIPGAGSMFFLGELFLSIEIPCDMPKRSRCGTCRACIDACPTHALNDNGTFKSELCLSYQTIEHRGNLSLQATKAMGNTIYGCDRCLIACPWNRHSPVTKEESMQPKAELLAMKKENWENLSIEDYRRLFKGSAVKRAKYEGLMRNINAAKKNKEAQNIPHILSDEHESKVLLDD